MTAPERRYSIEVSGISGEEAGRLLGAGIIDTAVLCKRTGTYIVQATRTGLGAAAVAFFQISAGEERIPFVTDLEATAWLRTQAQRAREAIQWNGPTRNLGIVKDDPEAS